MSREVIAVVRLAYGEVGYYDELSRIHLTASDPQREIFAGTNCTQIRRSVKSGRLRLLSGTLGEEQKIDFSKKGNEFSGILYEATNAVAAPVTPTVPAAEAPDIERKAAGDQVVKDLLINDEASVVGSDFSVADAIKPEIAEPLLLENSDETAEEETDTEESSKKSSRKRNAAAK